MFSADLRLARRDLEVDVAFELGSGRTLAITGPSGAGKSSVLAAIAGLAPQVRGRITCDGDVWLDSDRRVDLAPERRACGIVFQDGALFPHLCVWRNVAFGLRSTPRRDRREHATRALAAFGVDHLADASPRAISGGERRRVALARTLVREPRLLLLDEPLTALDGPTSDAAARTLGSVLAAAAGPAIVVTHDFTQASVLADEVAVMDGGRVVQLGTPDDLVGAPATAFVAELTGAAVLRGTAHRAGDGLAAVTLPSGAVVVSAGELTGPVAVVVRPWDVTLEPPGEHAESSARNRFSARVAAVTPLGGRSRVALELPEPLVAEVTSQAADRLGLRPGAGVTAVWKATATRLVARAGELDEGN